MKTYTAKGRPLRWRLSAMWRGAGHRAWRIGLANEIHDKEAEIITLRAENAHLKRALALTDALRNKERNLPL